MSTREERTQPRGRDRAGLPVCEPDHPLLLPRSLCHHITLGRSRRPAWKLQDDHLLPQGLHEPVRGRVVTAHFYDARTRTITLLQVG
ncbi:hypothetical protein ABZ478_36205 [Streptomyces sp. NPDC005706]|uniref:hypothetical protein n=1 Tax=Streptomyces sp. NPDC005706 TaxID=3157169 RepID=UPI0033CCE9FE